MMIKKTMIESPIKQDKLESKKEETNSRNVFSWEKYPQLCKLLFNN